ncbi:DUF580-domain-containing protein [Hanseniaspora valbyensis NRRL Y-1626]|uniref:Protein PNS1 n=1 Tax=Hanseniaspora valbyensis NRRL Y-1626 TaxID=766949 RepID=A0A1B7TCA0_9ASCO|nr:DUF580-domain-containing protein [Hanseniaspora valbyensis NRRL Y-1626]
MSEDTKEQINNNNNNNNNDYQFRQDEQYDLKHEGEGAPIGGSTVDELFPQEKPHWNDWPFIILFLIVLGGFIVISGIVFNYWNSNSSDYGSSTIYGNTSSTLNSNAAVGLIFSVAISVVLTCVGFIICRIHPRSFIICGIIFNIACGLGTAIMYLALKYWSAGIVFLVFTLFSAWCYWGMRSRIPLSVEILTVVMDVIKWYPLILLVAFIGACVAAGFSFWFALVITATYMRFDPKGNNGQTCDSSSTGSCSYSKLIGVMVVVFFCGYYITEVIKNIIHVSVSGVYGCWYYMAKSDQGPPKRPIWGSFRRAVTYCLGSICFGSLIVSILETIKATLNLVKNTVLQNSQWGQIGMIVINIIFSIINWMAQYFNHYAYSFIAIYGKPYLRAAKETYHMFREKGIDALINDNLINVAIGFYATFTAYIATLFTYLFLRFTKPDYNSNGDYTAPLMAFSFLISIQIVNIVNETIRSGTATFFICLGNDPEVFMHSYRDRFDRIFNAYPQVLQKLTHQNV